MGLFIIYIYILKTYLPFCNELEFRVILSKDKCLLFEEISDITLSFVCHGNHRFRTILACVLCCYITKWVTARILKVSVGWNHRNKTEEAILKLWVSGGIPLRGFYKCFEITEGDRHAFLKTSNWNKYAILDHFIVYQTARGLCRLTEHIILFVEKLTVLIFSPKLSCVIFYKCRWYIVEEFVYVFQFFCEKLCIEEYNHSHPRILEIAGPSITFEN